MNLHTKVTLLNVAIALLRLTALLILAYIVYGKT